MKFTASEKIRLSLALHLAIEWEESVIRTYLTHYDARRKVGNSKIIIAPEFRKETAKSRRNIKAFSRLLKKIGSNGQRKEGE